MRKLILVALLGMACAPVIHVKVYKIESAELTVARPTLMYRRLAYRPRAYLAHGVPYNNIVTTADCD